MRGPSYYLVRSDLCICPHRTLTFLKPCRVLIKTLNSERFKNIASINRPLTLADRRGRGIVFLKFSYKRPSESFVYRPLFVRYTNKLNFLVLSVTMYFCLQILIKQDTVSDGKELISDEICAHGDLNWPQITFLLLAFIFAVTLECI